MPHASKEGPARPFDVHEALERAARMRALRSYAGMSRRDLAECLGVTEKSIGRWESEEGRGYCPDDVLTMLAALVDRQRATAAAYADGLAARRGKGGAAQGGPCEPRKAGGAYELRKEGAAYEVGPCKPGVYIDGGGGPDSTPDGPRFDAGEADSMPGGGAGGRFDARAGGGSMPGADSMPCGAADSMPCDAVSMPCWPSQKAYEAFNHDGYYGVANATLRAIADELDRCGIEVEWHFPTSENIGMFDSMLIGI